ncbi:conserved hypothetical protein [Candidatus Desulfarcum epimagneticum]|uniref:C4-type zinc ribbon domain-containing protein n=1 Tax=uncultured Desulfobacteraceae bacterium TaxID=218296 RepID=A0A484HEL9_9BACT|nr:conserved hypothetical protein [uncultured Desulfobacteraceae bacterium]
MPKNIQEDINILVQLQDVENKIQVIRGGLEAEETKIQGLDSGLDAASKELETLEEKVAELKALRREYESDADLFSESIQKSNVKLSSVKTNKEYQSVLKEIEDIKQRSSENDEKMILCMEEIDQAEKDLALKHADHKEVSRRIENEKKAIREESESDRLALEKLEKESRGISERANPAILGQFLNIKKCANGVAISRVVDAICQGCNMNIPPQTYNELQACDSLRQCPFCQRIIYWKKEE